jgi:DNA-binding response OmpR family regulator
VVELTGAEFDLLVSLCDHAGRVIARERLIELSRTRLGDSSDRSVDVLVSRLRRKLSDAHGGADRHGARRRLYVERAGHARLSVYCALRSG